MAHADDITLNGRRARVLRAAFTLGALALAAVALSACKRAPQGGPEVFLPRVEGSVAAFEKVCVPAVIAQEDRAAVLARARAAGFELTADSADNLDSYLEGGGWRGEIVLQRPGAPTRLRLDPGFTGALVPINAAPMDVTCTADTPTDRVHALSPAATVAVVTALVEAQERGAAAVADGFGGVLARGIKFGTRANRGSPWIQYDRREKDGRFVEIIAPKLNSGGFFALKARTRRN